MLNNNGSLSPRRFPFLLLMLRRARALIKCDRAAIFALSVYQQVRGFPPLTFAGFFCGGSVDGGARFFVIFCLGFVYVLINYFCLNFLNFWFWFEFNKFIVKFSYCFVYLQFLLPTLSTNQRQHVSSRAPHFWLVLSALAQLARVPTRIPAQTQNRRPRA